jgi:hypothetical protein
MSFIVCLLASLGGGSPLHWRAVYLESFTLLAWLISYQSAVLFSQNKSATSNQPAVLFSLNKSAPVISHQPTEQAVW